ncbi:MAG: DUF362 domain-containing protein [Chloroflexota bacterium]
MAQPEFKRPSRIGGYRIAGGADTVASTNSGNYHWPFLERPPQEKRSEVAIVKCPVYALAEPAVREAIALLGGIERFCKKGDVVILKVNGGGAFPVEIADTTHPAVVAAMVKMCKEVGATVKVMEQPGFNDKADKIYTVTGIKAAALAAGVDELWDWSTAEYVEVDVPDARSFAKVKLPKALMEADVFIDLPKLKNNYMIGGLTLAIKSKLGLIPCDDRQLIHRTPVDMAAGCCDIAKAINHLHRLTLVDAVQAVEGRVHQGLVCSPGFLAASPDLVAVEAVCHEIVGYHPLESPAVQLAMKDGLGTGDLEEMDILGTRIQDVRYPFMRSHARFVQRFMNVKEYFGGTCGACLLAMQGVPPVVDPDKKYAVVSGTRALVANPLTDVDEVYLVGECACRGDHQFPGFMDKINAAKKVIKMGTCPGHTSIEEWNKRKTGGLYDHFMLLSLDMRAGATLPDGVRPAIVKAAIERRSGRVKELK